MGWFFLCLILFVCLDCICTKLKKIDDTMKRQGEWLRDEIRRLWGEQ
jgi:hypothetical protein